MMGLQGFRAHSVGATEARVACIGAGASGLTLCYKKEKEFGEGIDLVVYDQEIKRYYQSFAEERGFVEKYIKLRHEVVQTTWDEETSQWILDIDELLDNGEKRRFQDKVDFLIASIGIMNTWKWPDIPNREAFRGRMMHSAAYDTSVNLKGKSVIVIGSGASAVQIVPAIQPDAKKVTSFYRTPQWVSGGVPLEGYTESGQNFSYTKEQIEAFRNDPKLHLEHRKKMEDSIIKGFPFNILNHPIQTFGREAALTYVCRVIRKIQVDNIRSIDVKAEVLEEYNEHVHEWLKRSVWAGGCRSWYNQGKPDGKVIAHYPGSLVHWRLMTNQPRWEDYNIKYRSRNRFEFMGNGFTDIEVDNKDVSWYLNPEEIEKPLYTTIIQKLLQLSRDILKAMQEICTKLHYHNKDLHDACVGSQLSVLLMQVSVTMAHIKRIALLLGLSLPAFSIPLASDALANDIVLDKYIVRIAPNTVDADFEHHLQWVGAVHARSLMRRNTAGVEKTFEFGGFRAYAGEFDHETLEQIKQDKNVDAPWGLATLSSSAPLVDGNNAGYPYHFDSAAGEGSFAYVMDTGVTVAHPEFEGRAFKGYNAWAATGETFDDEFGHGSHVAGTIGSATFGVAKKSTIFDVKVARGIGYTTTAHMLDGYSWAVNNITNTPGRIAKTVINISIAVPKNEAINAAVDAAFDLGVTTIVAAANDGKDAGAKSPASASKAITLERIVPRLV
ncbi:Alkaline protease 1 [Colletotrichum sp. SAR11_240]|nr:Alkaline protease 1 [Colletotrichum sp. SAR11_240]